MQACKAEVSVVRKGQAACCFRRPNIDELLLQELHSQRWHGDAHPGYGFNILNECAQPVRSLAFERKDGVEQARVEVAKAVEKLLRSQGPD
jgi:hypothetical protein